VHVSCIAIAYTTHKACACSYRNGETVLRIRIKPQRVVGRFLLARLLVPTCDRLREVNRLSNVSNHRPGIEVKRACDVAFSFTADRWLFPAVATATRSEGSKGGKGRQGKRYTKIRRTPPRSTSLSLSYQSCVDLYTYYFVR
jgi:hypothetical protein